MAKWGQIVYNSLHKVLCLQYFKSSYRSMKKYPVTQKKKKNWAKNVKQFTDKGDTNNL